MGESLKYQFFCFFLIMLLSVNIVNLNSNIKIHTLLQC